MIPDNINWIATLAIASVAEFLTILCLLWIIRIQVKPNDNSGHICDYENAYEWDNEDE